MGDVPYRLWSDAPEPAPSHTIVIAKLKPQERGIRRVGAGAARLVDNARVRRITPVFDDGQDVSAAAERASFARTTRAGVAPPSRALGLVSVEVAANEDPKRIARYLESLGAEVEYAYVPHARRMFAKKVPRKPQQKPDPLMSRQWGHSAVRVAQARQRSGFKDATGIVVAVADTGVDIAHPDLEGVVSEYRNFVKGESSRDFEGHGTHVAGIIAAAMNNGVGVSGLCAARILAMKVLPSRVDWDAAAYYRALAYCIGRARVLNLSLGDEAFDPGERDVIADVIAAGIVVVAAMGNEFEEGNPKEYPAALPGVCAVGATDQADRRGAFSNTGSHISLCAPGVAIVSTTPTYAYAHGVKNYDSFDGTSMATPHVAAAAALLIAKNAAMTPAQVITVLQKKSARVSAMKARPSSSYGWGRLDIEAALR